MISQFPLSIIYPSVITCLIMGKSMFNFVPVNCQMSIGYDRQCPGDRKHIKRSSTLLMMMVMMFDLMIHITRQCYLEVITNEKHVIHVDGHEG